MGVKAVCGVGCGKSVAKAMHTSVERCREDMKVRFELASLVSRGTMLPCIES